MIEVSKNKFYELIGPRDICVLYVSKELMHFTTRSGLVVGKCFSIDDNNKYFIDEKNLPPEIKD